MNQSERSEQKNQSKYIRRRKIAIGAALLVCFYFVFSIITTQIAIYKQKQMLEGVMAEINEKQLENDELARVVENGGEAEYAERIAREKLGYASIDERVFVDLAGKEEQE